MRCAFKNPLTRTLWTFSIGLLLSVTAVVADQPTERSVSRSVQVSEAYVIPIPGGGGFAEDINNRGEVVGTYDGFPRSFIWSRENGFRDLGAFFATAINDCGEVAGTIVGPAGQHAMRLSSDGMGGEQIKDLGTLEPDNPNSWSSASGINERGDVVGTSSLGSGWSAFLWTEAIGMVAIAGPEYKTSAGDINNRRQILGTRTGDTLSVAALWDKTDSDQTYTIKWIGTLGRSMSGMALNEFGEAVGSGFTPYDSPIYNSAYWSLATDQIELWPYGPNPQLEAGSDARAIDDRSRLAGGVNLTPGPAWYYQAAVWTSPTEFHVLTDRPSTALDINIRGDVIGFFKDTNDGMGPPVIWKVHTPFKPTDLKAIFSALTARAICKSRGL